MGAARRPALDGRAPKVFRRIERGFEELPRCPIPVTLPRVQPSRSTTPEPVTRYRPGLSISTTTGWWATLR